MHREMHAHSRASAPQYFRTVETSGFVAGIVARVMREDVSAVDMVVFAAPVAVDLAGFTGVDLGGFRNSLGHELPP
jgi:fructose-specific phosphotransferase system component IIB